MANTTDDPHYYSQINGPPPSTDGMAPSAPPLAPTETQQFHGTQPAYPPPLQGQQPAPYPPPIQGQQPVPYPQMPQQQPPYPASPPPPYQYQPPPPQQVGGYPKAPLPTSQQQPGVQYNHAIVMSQPQQQPPAGHFIIQQAGQPQPAASGSTQGLAIASLVGAIVATICLGAICCTIPAIVLAAIALSDSRSRQAKSMAVASCVLTIVGWMFYVGIVVWVIVAGVNAANSFNYY